MMLLMVVIALGAVAHHHDDEDKNMVSIDDYFDFLLFMTDENESRW